MKYAILISVLAHLVAGCTYYVNRPKTYHTISTNWLKHDKLPVKQIFDPTKGWPI